MRNEGDLYVFEALGSEKHHDDFVLNQAVMGGLGSVRYSANRTEEDQTLFDKVARLQPLTKQEHMRYTKLVQNHINFLVERVAWGYQDLCIGAAKRVLEIEPTVPVVLMSELNPPTPLDT